MSNKQRMGMEKNTPNNWFEVVKEKIDKGAQKLNISSQTLIEGALALGFGFMIGYLAKKFGRPVLVSIILLILVLTILNYFSMIIIEWSKIKALLGIAPTEDVHEVLNHIGSWI